MATHSTVLAWGIPWTEEPGGLQFTELKSWTQFSNQTTTLKHQQYAGFWSSMSKKN